MALVGGALALVIGGALAALVGAAILVGDWADVAVISRRDRGA